MINSPSQAASVVPHLLWALWFITQNITDRNWTVSWVTFASYPSTPFNTNFNIIFFYTPVSPRRILQALRTEMYRSVCDLKVVMKNTAFCALTPCNIIEIYRSFESKCCCLHHMGRRRSQLIPSKIRQNLFSRLHRVLLYSPFRLPYVLHDLPISRIYRLPYIMHLWVTPGDWITETGIFFCLLRLDSPGHDSCL